MMNESEVQQRIQIDGAKYNCILQRNNSGALKDAFGRVVRFGLANISEKINKMFKSSDLIGPTTITITPEMVGKEIAVFTAVEVKAQDWKYSGKDREVAQKNYIDWVIARGGYAGFANSVDSFRKIIGR